MHWIWNKTKKKVKKEVIYLTWEYKRDRNNAFEIRVGVWWWCTDIWYDMKTCTLPFCNTNSARIPHRI